MKNSNDKASWRFVTDHQGANIQPPGVGKLCRHKGSPNTPQRRPKQPPTSPKPYQKTKKNNKKSDKRSPTKGPFKATEAFGQRSCVQAVIASGRGGGGGGTPCLRKPEGVLGAWILNLSAALVFFYDDHHKQNDEFVTLSAAPVFCMMIIIKKTSAALQLEQAEEVVEEEGHPVIGSLKGFLEHGFLGMLNRDRLFIIGPDIGQVGGELT